MTLRRSFMAMCSRRAIIAVCYIQYIIIATFARGSTTSSSLWQTLHGKAPLVAARGGFSGLFPDSSDNSYELARITSLTNVIFWCEVQLTKDKVGICFPDLRLENSSDISDVSEREANQYVVNGSPLQGFFSIDFTLNELVNVALTQGIYSRTDRFDRSFRIMTVQDVYQMKPQGFWLNIQHDTFFSQHNLSMRNFMSAASRRMIIDYISSPEVNFLRGITKLFAETKTKLVFCFLGKAEIEPTTNRTCSLLLKNLTYIKTFASGILVPKTYIWPVDEKLYLQDHTSLVTDAHKVGLEVFASDFSIDLRLSYNYSHNPVAEYLSFIDNGDFSVDGLLSDFPVTPSAAIDLPASAKPLVISHNGASGDYPGCTDVAYKQAILDGADVIDCPVQMSKDGIPFCLSSINLIDGTMVANSIYNNLISTIPQMGNGIFSFSLNWTEIQHLTPVISNPFSSYSLYRNPKYKNAGKFMSLLDFLLLARNVTSLSGVLVSIENAAYLVEKQGLSVTDAVADALEKAGYNNQTTKKVMIQSSNSSVLEKFKGKNYELVYEINEIIRDVLNSTIINIKKFANSVLIHKNSIYPQSSFFLTGVTNIVPKLQSFELPVYVELFCNEFASQANDFYTDPIVEINTFVQAARIDGIVTDFPRTAALYRNNRCLNMDPIPSYMEPVPIGVESLMHFITDPQLMPPAIAPYPTFTNSNVDEPPLPPVVKKSPIPISTAHSFIAPSPSTSATR
ncbi:hypothetical protein Nepgr_007622 [Nepenthes gracilis]|uniref:glycerophosphodiester phosphodiesterase n=1 Tax=Nepenthes gracilis TaxID=150966 RepID=A0AAD3S778_NEPGR|nr:hypothetical protein Nepgr_007622 [Nepenthes gracilis]